MPVIEYNEDAFFEHNEEGQLVCPNCSQAGTIQLSYAVWMTHLGLSRHESGYGFHSQEVQDGEWVDEPKPLFFCISCRSDWDVEDTGEALDLY